MFKVGDKVHCSRLDHDGIVIVVDHKDPMYPLEVEFEDGDTEVYTEDGRIFEGEDICLVKYNDNIGD